MTGMDLDRRLEAWMSDEAPRRAPDRVLSVALDRVDHTPQRRSRPTMPIAWHSLTRTRRLVLVAAALALLGAAVIVGALIVRPLLVPTPPTVLLVRGEDNDEQPTAILVVERRADGTEEVIARFTAEQLGGTPQLWLGAPVVSDLGHLAVPVMDADGTYGYAVADLRDPTAPVMNPDVSGDYAAFGPDGTLGVSTPEGLGMFDPFTGRTSSTGLTPVDGNPPTPPTALDRLLTWTTDGSGVLADQGMFLSQPDGTVVASAIGTLERDGDFATGTVPLDYDGVRARRAAPDGTLLRCAGGYDDCGLVEWDLYAVTSEDQQIIWDNPDTTRMISDFAWATDGGLWLLLESAAPGPRLVTLVRVATDGNETTVATFDGPADDPDPNSYFQSATFTGFAPDDSRIGIRIAGENGSPGSNLLLDPASGLTQEIAGAIAGWRSPDAEPAARPDVVRIVPTDEAIRGLWADPTTLVRIGSTTIEIATGDGSVTGEIEATEPDVVAISGAMDPLGCDATAIGRYRWSIEDDQLRLEAVEEPCAERGAALADPLDAALPNDSNGPPHVASGRTYRAGTFAAPFLVTLPPRDATVEVSASSPGQVSLSVPFSPDGSTIGMVSVSAPAQGMQDVCDRFGTPTPLPGPGVAGILASLEAAGIERRDETTVTVDGHPAQRFTIVAPPACDGYLSLFADADGQGSGVREDATLIVFELDDGTPIVIATSPDSDGPDARSWQDAVVASLRFDDR